MTLLRQQALLRLASETFDLLVLGGGITGCAIARDAALRGLSVALVDKGDFASGTSSKSSKLVHGGLRYLEQRQLRLVFEGTNERALLMRVAPHLVRPLEFLVPSYEGDRHGLMVLDAGLWIYDALSKFSSPRRHRTHRAPRIHALEPALNTHGLKGGILYYDCITDDARLTLENLLDAISLGAVAANHLRATKLERDTGKFAGAEVHDEIDGDKFSVRAKVVVNATGPWCDEIRQLTGEQPILHTSKGVHVVVDAARLPVSHAVVMNENRRVVFCIPWPGRTVIGTTDTFYEGPLDGVFADSSDVEYLLRITNRYFPEARLQPADVLATWAGLRPLIRPDGAVGSASDVSREHHVLSQPGLITIAGGKLTTHRRMAIEVVDEAGKQLGKIADSATEDRPLPGAQGPIDEKAAGEWALLYGTRAASIAERISQNAALGVRLDAELPFVLAQVDVAVEEELAVTLDDVLSRRLCLLLRGRDQGLSAIPLVAARMAEKLGWSETRTSAEIDRYRRTVDLSRRFRAGQMAATKSSCPRSVLHYRN